MSSTPTITGIFIHSHIAKLRYEKGEEGITELERRLGKPAIYSLLGRYPVKEEIEIIGHVLDILTDGRYEGDTREFESGRLHAQNFLRTTLGILVASSVPKTAEGFQTLILRSAGIARRVFRNTNFSAQMIGGHIMVKMENNDYSIEHFRGFFHELMEQWGLTDIAVDTHERAPKTFEYTLAWERSLSFNFIWQ